MAFIGQAVSEEKVFEYYNDMYLALGQGQTTPGGQFVFININILPICSFPVNFLQENDIFHFSPFKCIGDLS